MRSMGHLLEPLKLSDWCPLFPAYLTLGELRFTQQCLGEEGLFEMDAVQTGYRLSIIEVKNRQEPYTRPVRTVL